MAISSKSRIKFSKDVYLVYQYYALICNEKYVFGVYFYYTRKHVLQFASSYHPVMQYLTFLHT